MKIAIDISPLESGHKNRGTGVYIKNIIDALQKYDHKNSYVFFKENSQIPSDSDLVYYPYFDIFFLTLPILHRIPRMVTVHDIIPLVFPDHFNVGIRGIIKSKIQTMALTNSEHIFVSSTNTQKDLVKMTHIPDFKISTVYLAASPIFLQQINANSVIDVAKKYKLPDKFILYVGDVNWNKNITGLITSFCLLKKNSVDRNLKLYLVGKSFVNLSITETSTIYKLIARSGYQSDIIMPGYIPDADLRCIYSRALAYVQPSFYEGFGFPVLEAMACGCPVVAADNSSLSETSGPAIKVNANNYQSISEGILKILNLNDKARKQIQSDSRVWSSKFTWEKTVTSITSTYEKIIQ